MPLAQALVLAVIQGFTELLPISSSGYMIIASWALGWQAPSAGFDAAVHLGSLLALALFFTRDWMLILKSLRRGRSISLGGDDDLASRTLLEQRRRIGDNRRRLSITMAMPARSLLKSVALGTLPALAVGAALYPIISSESARSPELAGGMFIVTAAVLLMGHYATNQRLTGKDPRVRSKEIGRWDALIIGAAQAAALLPGISRSAATISAGLTRGIPAVAAIRFSYLLSAPVIIAASGFSAFTALVDANETFPGWTPIAIGIATSFITAYLAVAAFMWIVRRIGTMSLLPFSAFTAATGAITLIGIFTQ